MFAILLMVHTMFFSIILVPNVNLNMYAPSFISRFMESHAVMFQGNAGLKPKEGELTSKPWQWPINYRVRKFILNNICRFTSIYERETINLLFFFIFENRRIFLVCLITVNETSKQ